MHLILGQYVPRDECPERKLLMFCAFNPGHILLYMLVTLGAVSGLVQSCPYPVL